MGGHLLCRSRSMILDRLANGTRRIVNLGCWITQDHAEFPVDSLSPTRRLCPTNLVAMAEINEHGCRHRTPAVLPGVRRALTKLIKLRADVRPRIFSSASRPTQTRLKRSLPPGTFGFLGRPLANKRRDE
jgi:hypothetical protein